MKVIRKLKIETNDVCVGDQINVKLDGFGKFTATAQRVSDNEMLFLFDEVITMRPMNRIDTNAGGFESSDMNDWLHKVFLKAFSKKIRNSIIDISLPTYEEIFGCDDFCTNNIESNNDEQFDLMKLHKNKIAFFENKSQWYWLRNKTKPEFSAASFARVNANGHAYYYHASNSGGVRPEFWMKKI